MLNQQRNVTFFFHSGAQQFWAGTFLCWQTMQQPTLYAFPHTKKKLFAHQKLILNIFQIFCNFKREFDCLRDYSHEYLQKIREAECHELKQTCVNITWSNSSSIPLVIFTLLSLIDVTA